MENVNISVNIRNSVFRFDVVDDGQTDIEIETFLRKKFNIDRHWSCTIQHFGNIVDGHVMILVLFISITRQYT